LRNFMSDELPNGAKMLWDAIPKQMQERLINNRHYTD
jgi:hypothetical protein